MKSPIILIGGGGHCKSVIDVIEAEGKYEILGIIDQKEKLNELVLGYKIIGTDEDLDKWIKTCPNFHITIGHIQSNIARVKLFDLVKSKGGNFPVILSPSAYISKHTLIGEGTIVMHKAIINAATGIGKNCIINTAAVTEHDVTIGDHCHISTGAFINGACKINTNTFVGSNATLVQEVEIGQNNLIAAGAVVTKSTEPGGMYAGNPAKLKRKLA